MPQSNNQDEQPILLSREQLSDLAGDVTENVLLRLGFDLDKPEEIRKDLVHLRRWRIAVDKVGNAGIVSAVTTIVGGVAAAMWIGFQHFIGRA